MNQNEQLVSKPFVIEDNHEDYQRLLATLHQLQRQYQSQEFLIGMEAISDYWKNLSHFLKKQSEACAMASAVG
jgi:transposase